MLTPHRHAVAGLSLHAAHGPANGPPLVLLHGVMRSWRSFAPILPALLPSWHVLAVDQRGHGASERGRSYLVRDYLSDAIAFIRDHVAGPVVVYGHSLGALVAAGVAAALPERVAAVVLEDPPSPAFLADVDATAYGAIFRGMQAVARDKGASVSELSRRLAAIELPGGVRLGDTRDAGSLRLSAAMLRDLDPEALTPLIDNRWLDGIDLFATLRSVRCPALLLRADDQRGGMLRSPPADEMMSALADGYRIDFPGIGHQIHWLATDALLRGVLAFLASI